MLGENDGSSREQGAGLNGVVEGLLPERGGAPPRTAPLRGTSRRWVRVRSQMWVSLDSCPAETVLHLKLVPNSYHDRQPADIRPDKHTILHAISPPSLRLGANSRGATPRTRGSDHQSGHTAIMGSRSVARHTFEIPSLTRRGHRSRA